MRVQTSEKFSKKVSQNVASRQLALRNHVTQVSEREREKNCVCVIGNPVYYKENIIYLNALSFLMCLYQFRHLQHC
jgi:hypothetical protein